LGEGEVAERKEGLDGLADAAGGDNDGHVDLLNDIGAKHLARPRSRRSRRRRRDLNRGRAWLRSASPWRHPGFPEMGPHQIGTDQPLLHAIVELWR
jgi:hypothetical protein